MTKISRILMLAHPETDYLAYMMYDGLYKVLGKDNLAVYPFIRHYQGGIDDWYILDDGKKGYTIPSLQMNSHESIDRSFEDLVINIHSFDIIYMSSGRTYARKALDQFIAICGRNNLPPIIFSEGEDYQDLITIRNIKQKYNPLVCFKRELLQSDIGKYPDLHPLHPLPFSAITDNLPPDNPNKDIDVFAVFGNTYPLRENIVRKILSSHLPEKYNVTIDIINHKDVPEMITPWGDKRKDATYHLIPHSKYLDHMSRAKINIVARGWGYDTIRRFEAQCFSGLVISDNLPIITPDPFIDNVHITYYNNDLSDLINRIEYILNADNERRRVGMGGRNHCMKYHTTEARARYFINKVEQKI